MQTENEIKTEDLTATECPVDRLVMLFSMTHNFFGCVPDIFRETDAPDWLTGASTIPGSTMDSRWFWQDHILTLNVGESIKTTFRTITRIR